MATSLLNPKPESGLRFDLSISLGTIVQIATIVVLGIVGYTTIQNNQEQFKADQAQMRMQIDKLAEREQSSAELSAREAAIIDTVERRIGRIEAVEDRRK
jgi:uncharacterized protein HemX